MTGWEGRDFAIAVAVAADMCTLLFPSQHCR